MSAPDLHATLAWTQAAVLPGGEGVPADASAWVLPSATLASRDRVMIYRRMIAIRGRQTLAGIHPRLRRALGEQAFRRLAAEYLAAHASRSWTLARLGDALPEFLRTWSEAPAPERASWTDLARYERARSTAALAPAPPPLRDAAAGLLRGPRAERAVLVPADGLQVLRLEHAVHEPSGAVPTDAGGEMWRKRPTCLAVHRTGAGVGTLELDAGEHTILSQLRDRTPLGQVVEAAGSTASLGVALRRFLGSGLFVDARLAC